MKNAFAIFIINFLLIPSVAFTQNAWKKELQNYIQKLSRPDGGYGWEDQYDSHLTPTYAVTGILFDIGELPADKARLAEFIRSHHPQKATKNTKDYYTANSPQGEAGPSGTNMRNLVYQQLQAILWLGGDVRSFDDDVKSWKSQAGMLANYESHNYGGLYQETMTPICNNLLGLAMPGVDSFLTRLASCRRANGSFNNAPAATGGDGNILNTYWALYAKHVLSAPATLTAETIKWLQACQLKNGGFTHQPNPLIGANDDAIYTWAAIKALQLLGAKPSDVQATVSYLTSLRNADGGFGDRPGLHSTPVASFYAIDALAALNNLPALDKSSKPKAITEPRPDFSGYHVYSVQFQAQGQGSPKEAVMLADSLHIHLWGVKYPVAGWLEAAQKIADEKHVPITFFIANEPHDNLVTVPGMGSFNHVLDYIAPARAEVNFSEDATFDQLKKTTLQQLKKANGGLMLQVSNNEPLARMLLDESINTGIGYIAISTVHFGQNFMFWLPYLAEYRYRLPLVTLQDAHGTESWSWADELTNHRTLFIAKKPGYDDMVQALKNNWVAGVRHDSVSNYKTRMLGGLATARTFISARENEWKWWGPADKLHRPQAVIAVLSNNDSFEAGKPVSGLNIRVRTRWNSLRQTLKSAAVTLERLSVDGREVKAEPVEVGRGAGFTDAYYLYKWGEAPKGEHKIEALVKDVQSGKMYTYSQIFNN